MCASRILEEARPSNTVNKKIYFLQKRECWRKETWERYQKRIVGISFNLSCRKPTMWERGIILSRLHGYFKQPNLWVPVQIHLWTRWKFLFKISFCIWICSAGQLSLTKPETLACLATETSRDRWTQHLKLLIDFKIKCHGTIFGYSVVCCCKTECFWNSPN